MSLPALSYGDDYINDTFGQRCEVGDRVAHACSAGIRVGIITKITVIWQNAGQAGMVSKYSPWDVVSFTLERQNGGIKKFLRYDYHPDYLLKAEL